MNCELRVNAGNLIVARGFYSFLVGNIGGLVEEMGHYPVMLRCGKFMTILVERADVEDLIGRLVDGIEWVEGSR